MDCRASQYLIDMYRELQQLRNMPRQNYSFKATDLPNLDNEVENFMTVYKKHTPDPNVALLDSGSTHTILTKAEFFHFQSEKSWSYCKILTMAGSRTLRFREGRATIVLPEGFPPQLWECNVRPRYADEPDQLSGSEGEEYSRLHEDARWWRSHQA